VTPGTEPSVLNELFRATGTGAGVSSLGFVRQNMGGPLAEG
jgi:hypothetical protein